MTQNPELSVVGRIEAMPELPEPCGAMSVDDGPYTGKGSDLPHMQGARLERSVDGYSAAQMHAYALTYASQTLASRDGEIARLRGDLLPLQEFMDAVFGEFPEHGDIDGLDLQHIAAACGLLKRESTITPCGEHCGCAEIGIADGTETQCYRVQPVMRRARIASAKRAALAPQPTKEQSNG